MSRANNEAHAFGEIRRRHRRGRQLHLHVARGLDHDDEREARVRNMGRSGVSPRRSDLCPVTLDRDANAALRPLSRNRHDVDLSDAPRQA